MVMNEIAFHYVKKIKAFWEIMRLEHGVMIFMGIFIGAIIAGKGTPPFEKTVFSFLTALLLEAATFSLNDYFDFEVDRLNNRFDRPLVRGDIQPNTAVVLYFLLLPLGLLASLMVNITCFVIAVVNAAVATLYDVKFKEIKVVSNFYIAFIMAIPFVFGATAVSRVVPTIIFIIAFIAFLSGVAREIMKDVQDFEGDSARKTRSLPLYFGKRGANAVAAMFYVIAVFLSFLPFFISFDNTYYHDVMYLCIVLVTDLLLLYIATRIFKTTDTSYLNYCRKLSLCAIFIGLIAFLAGAFA